MFFTFRSVLFSICLLLSCISGLGYAIEPVHHSPFVIVTPESTGTFPLAQTVAVLLGKHLLHSPQNDLSLDQLEEILREAKRTHTIPHLHILPTPEVIHLLKKKKFRVVFLMRDPRDHAIFILQQIHHNRWQGTIENRDAFLQLNRHHQLNALVRGKRFGLSGGKVILRKNLSWLQYGHPFVLAMRYEDLVGKQSGATSDQQLKTVTSLIKHIEADISTARISIHFNKLLNNKSFWNKSLGDVGAWKQEFNKENVEVYKTAFGKQLIKMGYEKNEHWQSDIMRFHELRHR